MLSYHTCPLATLGGKDTGGMNVYVRDLTRQLGRMGVHVDVFTRSQDEHVPHVLHDLGFGNRVVHVPSGPEVPLAKPELVSHIPQFVEGVLEFAETKKIEYDLVHSHYWMSGIAALTIKQEWNVPVVHMFHTLGEIKKRVSRGQPEAESENRQKGERVVLQTADRIIVPTQAEFAQLQWLYLADPRKIVIIPPGVDLSRFYPIPPDEAKEYIGIPPCEKVLLFVGRIEPLKGIDNLIEAIAIMRRQGITVCLSIIGGDSENGTDNYSNEMRRLIAIREKAGLQDMVAFLGQRGQDTLPYYYSAAEAVVMPSYYESFGMVALEAMACGIPVVASQVGGLPFLVQDGVTGYTVPIDDPSALADRLIKIIQNPELRLQLGQEAIKVSQKYSWENIAEKIMEIYQGLIEQRSVRSNLVESTL